MSLALWRDRRVQWRLTTSQKYQAEREKYFIMSIIYDILNNILWTFRIEWWIYLILGFNHDSSQSLKTPKSDDKFEFLRENSVVVLLKMSLGTRQYRYSYTPPEMEDDLAQDTETDSALVINVRWVQIRAWCCCPQPQTFRCPTLSGGSWCYKLYGLVLAGLGLIISFIWVSFAL